MSDVSPIPAPPPGSDSATRRELPDLGGLVSGLDDLAERPVAEHHDRLAEVHEALHTALHSGLPEQQVAN